MMQDPTMIVHDSFEWVNAAVGGVALLLTGWRRCAGDRREEGGNGSTRGGSAPERSGLIC